MMCVFLCKVQVLQSVQATFEKIPRTGMSVLVSICLFQQFARTLIFGSVFLGYELFLKRHWFAQAKTFNIHMYV